MSGNTSILVTGATGYIGGRLIPKLLEHGYCVRAVARSLEKLKSRPWAQHENVTLAAADVLDLPSLAAAARGCEVVYYLVHSMLPGQRDFGQTDRQAAENMRDIAAQVGLSRIIYLGGLGEDAPELSAHLRSRAEVATILSAGSVPVTVLRAAMIIGSGSASFEILRYLVDRLPVMITPRWVNTPCQPIAVRNVITYLIECLRLPQTAGHTYDIGAPEVITYRKLMEIYAQEAKLPPRLILPVPVLTPRLSSYWIHLVTPLPASIARPLAEGLRNPVICQDHRLRDLVPQELLDSRQAIRAALRATQAGQIHSHWTDAGKVPDVAAVYAGDPGWAGGTEFRDAREGLTTAAAERLWQVVTAIGGQQGWYHANWLWQLRGMLDKWFGGVGLRRGRRDARSLKPGDALDFWRVLVVEPGKRLVLTAEMKLPGTATLEFFISPGPAETTRLRQQARFRPRGLWGLMYWFLVLPFHAYIFQGMLRNILRKAERA